MTIKLQAAQRLVASDSPQWFLDMTEEQQHQYLEDHPKSRLHPGAAAHRDKGQIKPHGMKPGEVKTETDFLKRQIKYAKDDIAELEADGEDATKERKVLKDSLDELRDLQKG